MKTLRFFIVILAAIAVLASCDEDMVIERTTKSVSTAGTALPLWPQTSCSPSRATARGRRLPGRGFRITRPIPTSAISRITARTAIPQALPAMRTRALPRSSPMLTTSSGRPTSPRRQTTMPAT